MRIRIQPGPRGIPGEPFNVDIVGPASGRAATATDPAIQSYLEEDTGLLFVKRADGTYPATGIPFRGPQGLQGPAGVNGAPGTDGAAGPPGDPGPSAYEVAVSDGFVGTRTEWLTSIVGPEGPAGANGAPGAPGAPGQDGAPGAQGPKGDTGPAGADGLSFASNASGTLAERAQYDAQGPGFSYYVIEEDAYYFRETSTVGVWSVARPRTVPGPQGPQGLQGLTGPPGPGVPTGGQTGMFIRKKSGANYDFEYSLPDQATSSSHGTVRFAIQPEVEGTSTPQSLRAIDTVQLKAELDRRLALPLRRSYLSLGGSSSGIGTTTAYTNFNLRNVLRLAVATTRWRLKVRNHTCTTETSHSGAIQITGGWFGKQLQDSSTYFAWNGHFDAAPSQVIAASSTPADGSEWVSPWVTDSGSQFQPHTDHVLSLGLIASAGQAIAQASGRCFVNTTATGSAQASVQAPTLTWTTPQPLSIVVEFEFRGNNPIILLISDSIGEGTGTALGQRDSYLERWALANNGVAIKAGIGGSTALDYQSVGYKYDRFSHMDTGSRVYADVDAAMVSLGTNDIGGGATATTIQARLQNNMRYLKNTFSPDEQYWGLITPRNAFTTTQEGYRNTLNEWMAGLPVSTTGAAYFNDSIASIANFAQIGTRFDSGDAIHPNTAAHAKMLAALPFHAMARV